MGKEVIKVIPKIVQISDGSLGLVALDEYGDIWRYHSLSERWIRIKGLPETVPTNSNKEKD